MNHRKMNTGIIAIMELIPGHTHTHTHYTHSHTNTHYTNYTHTHTLKPLKLLDYSLEPPAG